MLSQSTRCSICSQSRWSPLGKQKNIKSEKIIVANFFRKIFFQWKKCKTIYNEGIVLGRYEGAA